MQKPTYAKTTLIFRILLGLTYFLVFLFHLPQILTLIGKNGILPIKELIKNNPDLNFINFPTLHLWLNSDLAIILFMLLGLILSIFLIIGFYPKISLIGLFILYLSIITSGRTFFTFQWDNLLLETTLISFFLPLGYNFLSKRKTLVEPAKPIIFLQIFLLFRLYFESGLAKIILGRQDWLGHKAMSIYYQTSPLPSLAAWFFHNLPQIFHHISDYIVLIIELIIPLIIFYPRKTRIISFYIFTFSNLIMFISGNYGFFNPLSIFIGIFLLDDQHLEKLFTKLKLNKIKNYFDKIKIYQPKHQKQIFYASLILATILVPLSIYEFTPVLGHQPPQIIQKTQQLYAPFRIINRYHLFPGILKEKILVDILGSKDQKTWQPYYFKYSPSDPKTIPPQLLFYNARFPFRYSFLTLGELNSEYLRNILIRICEDPNNLKQILRKPYLEHPKYLKLDFYKYTFTTPKQLFTKKSWWNKEYKGSINQVIIC